MDFLALPVALAIGLFCFWVFTTVWEEFEEYLESDPYIHYQQGP